ncbi:hypothetical protein [Rhizobium sp. Kim5]|uniref:hypothetical protein n=1 Tax=Rhizobium sp. Kim5 TaxID=2020311 RepID=UPI000A358F7E|nr:hypothetical protein [Rhizobium sp. Kim5]
MFNSASALGGGVSEDRAREIAEELTLEAQVSGHGGWVSSDLALLAPASAVDLYNASPDSNEIRISFAAVDATDFCSICLQLLDGDGEVFVGVYSGHSVQFGLPGGERVEGLDNVPLITNLTPSIPVRGHVHVSRSVQGYLVTSWLFDSDRLTVGFFDAPSLSNCSGVRIICNGALFVGGTADMKWKK